MRQMLPIAIVLLLLPSCSSTPHLTLDQIQPKRVFALPRPVVLESIRLFARSQEFRLDSFEEETGRVIGHRTHRLPSANENKMVIMNLRVYPVDTEHTEVNAKFGFTSTSDALTRDEESILVDAYTALYDFLERKSN